MLNFQHFLIKQDDRVTGRSIRAWDLPLPDSPPTVAGRIKAVVVAVGNNDKKIEVRQVKFGMGYPVGNSCVLLDGSPPPLCPRKDNKNNFLFNEFDTIRTIAKKADALDSRVSDDRSQGY